MDSSSKLRVLDRRNNILDLRNIFDVDKNLPASRKTIIIDAGASYHNLAYRMNRQLEGVKSNSD